MRPMRAAETNTPPAFAMPAGACDAHFHVFEPGYPHVAEPLYTFPDGTVGQYLAMTEALGIERMVLVQPTFYGTDNSLLVDTLKRLGPRCGGVVRIEEDTTDAELDGFHEIGVRAIRLDRSPGPLANGGTHRLHPPDGRPRHPAGLAPAVLHAGHDRPRPAAVPRRPRGHLRHRPHGVHDRARPSVRARLLALLSQGSCWIKLSGAYRVAKDKPLSSVAPLGRALVAARPDRLIWGSDWPHLPNGQRDTGEILNLLADWAPTQEARQEILVNGPTRLFFA